MKKTITLLMVFTILIGIIQTDKVYAEIILNENPFKNTVEDID